MYNTNIRPKTYLVSSPCGTGKSFAMLKRISRLKNVINCLVVLPSIELIREQQRILMDKFDCDSLAIHSEDEEKESVLFRVIQFFKDAPHDGTILFLTWETFRKLEYIHNKDNWRIFIDEVPQIDYSDIIRLSDNPTVLTNILTIETDNCPDGIGKLVPIDPPNYETIIERGIKRDAALKTFEDLLKDVGSSNHDVFVPVRWWRELERGKKKNYYVPWVSMMNPNLFYGATILAANIENSILYHWFKDYHNVSFEINRAISQNLLPKPTYHNRIVAEYLTDLEHWSKTAMKSEDEEGDSLKSSCDSVLCDVLENEKFLFCANKEKYDSDKWEIESLDGCEKVPTMTKGLNKYDSYDCVVYLPALNRKKHHISLLNQLGITSETILLATGYENLYQTIMRTSLRKPDGDRVRVIVPTKNEIQFLSDTLDCDIPAKWIGDDEYTTLKPIVDAMNGSNVVSLDVRKYQRVIEGIQLKGFVEKKKLYLLYLGMSESQWKRNIESFEEIIKSIGFEIVNVCLSKSRNRSKQRIYYVWDREKFDCFVSDKTIAA